MDQAGGRILIGTSGFSYRDWIGPVYPPGTKNADMLPLYAERFPVVELNYTYYAMPDAGKVEAMLEKAGGLRFSVKANRAITHEPKDLETACRAFMAGIEPMRRAGRLSAVLLQFPFGVQNDGRGRELLAGAVDRLAEVPLVVEFRRNGWLEEGTFSWLRERGVGFCCVDEPRLPGLPPPMTRLTARLGYLRLHGRNKETWWRHEQAWERYNYLYNEAELNEWVPSLLAMEKTGATVLVFANNHYLGQAVKNAEMLIDLIERARQGSW